MTQLRVIDVWCCCGWLLLVFVQSISPSSNQAQLMSFCNQTLNISSRTMTFLPSSSYSTSCCNITFVPSSIPDALEQMTIDIFNVSMIDPAIHVWNSQMESIRFYSSSTPNRIVFKSDIHSLPIRFSLCPKNVSSFHILFRNISKGPCKSNQYLCSTNNGQDQWCIDESSQFDSHHSCPHGMMEESNSQKPASRSSPMKIQRTIRGGIVTTIIVFGLLLIVASIVIAIAFVYIRRKNQRRRQFTYSLESTSDEWEPSGTGYHLFDNWNHSHRRTTDNQIDHVIIDSSEHIPIANNFANR